MTELTNKMRTCAAFMAEQIIPHIDDNRIYETCERHVRAMQDAAALLCEAADRLEASPAVATALEKFDAALAERRKREAFGPYGEPMALLEPIDQTPAKPPLISQPLFTDDTWVAPGGALPGVMASGTRSPRACPRCDSRAYKRVFRRERKMYLHCGICGNEWLFPVRELKASHG